MAITVTATASGTGSSNGTVLAVFVLNNASMTQSGVTVSNSTVTTPSFAITPGQSGNWVYGGILNGAAATAFGSRLANTTSKYAGLVNSGDYGGIFRSTGVTTTSSTTYGWTTPSASSGSIAGAALEVQNNGSTLSEDASTPAVVSTTSAKTITTASFSPPAGTVLIAVTVVDWTGSGSTTVAVTDSGSAYTWTQKITVLSGEVAAVWTGIPKVVAVTPSSLAVTASFPSPTVHAGAGVTTSSLAASASFPAPAIRADENLTTTALAVTTAFPAPAISTSSNITPSALAASASFPAPTVTSGSNASVTTTVLAAAAAFPAPVISVGALTFQYLAPYQVTYLQYLGPPGSLIPALGEIVTGAFTAASNLPFPSPPSDGRWSVNGAFQPRFLRERDIPRSGWSVHDEFCDLCLKRHRHVCQE